MKAVDEKGAARTAGNGRDRHSEEVLFSLFQQRVIDGVAGLCIVSLPGRKGRLRPEGDSGIAPFEGRIPAGEVGCQGRSAAGSPKVG